MKQMKTLTVGGETYRITDPEAARIDDGAISPEKTWSGQKIDSVVGGIETALDSILAIQNSLISGDGA